MSDFVAVRNYAVLDVVQTESLGESKPIETG